ncbi:MarR family winged helix-turn-helix transcriptional regulator [Sulfobacillus harzensis]|uniref:MarR family transcriptional regulator n=1 Tax=Sulfobacillus harzensis TaxID=2729629 RepID=A0A7Y0L6H7_9FIRM|nr:MarR family transcriptional regulator [Sulfobacillus harzensis]NMP24218.1 MarR family transcriptional regulator [Sulfobacillus harzensis]
MENHTGAQRNHDLALSLIDLQDALGGQYGLLSRPKLRLMVKLTHGPIKVSELALRLNISSPAVSQMIDKLASDGLVIRSGMGSDQRLVGVGLTEAGRTAVNEALNAFESRVSTLLRGFSEQEKQELLHLLKKMAEVT